MHAVAKTSARNIATQEKGMPPVVYRAPPETFESELYVRGGGACQAGHADREDPLDRAVHAPAHRRGDPRSRGYPASSPRSPGRARGRARALRPRPRCFGLSLCPGQAATSRPLRWAPGVVAWDSQLPAAAAIRRVMSSGPTAFSGNKRIVTSRLLSLGACACAATPPAIASATQTARAINVVLTFAMLAPLRVLHVRPGIRFHRRPFNLRPLRERRARTFDVFDHESLRRAPDRRARRLQRPATSAG